VQEIAARCVAIAHEINELHLENAVLISVLSGAFMFTADVCRHLHNAPELHFVKISSYSGMCATAAPTLDVALKIDIRGKDVIVFEDIVDSGETIRRIYEYCLFRGAASIRIAALLLKPAAYTLQIPIDFVGFEISNEFVVGYGLDYNNAGRTLPDIYQLKITN
jgi:hypoxanthine phosphoribosyltransferase